jgi:proteasome accessory factor C
MSTAPIGPVGPVGAGAQVARLLALVPYALTRQEVKLEEAATDLGVTPKQIISDLKVLMYCGWPGYLPGDYIEVDLDALEGDGVIRVANAEYLARPLRLTVSEASALIVALRTLRDSADADVVPVVDRTLAKLEAAAQDGATAAGQVDVHLGERERVLGQLRTRLQHALDRGRQVRLTYYVPARDESTQRVVDPLGLLTGQGMTYLDGWCHLADDRRLFRLDRIESADVLDAPAEAHPDAAPRDLSAGLFQPGDDATTAVIRLGRRARWVAEYYPVEKATEVGDGVLEVELRVADPRWLQRLMLRLAPDAELVEPREFTEALRAAVSRARELYE